MMRISHRIVRLNILTSSILFLLLFSLFYLMGRRLSYRIVEDEMKNFAGLIAYQIAPSIEFGDTLAVRNTLLSLKNYPIIRFVKVFDLLGEEIVSVEFSSGKSLTVMESVRSGETPIGGISIGIDPSFIEKAFRNFLIFSFLPALLILGISLFPAYTMGKKISEPILRVRDSLSSIAKGEGDLTMRLPEEGEDEVGELSRSFNLFVEGIEKIVKSIKKTTGEVEYHVSDVSSSIEELTATVEEISTSMNNVVKNVEEQKEELEKMEDRAEEMGESTKGVWMEAKDAEGMSLSIMEKAGGGMEVVEKVEKGLVEMEGALREVKEKGKSVTNLASSLFEISRSITEITKDIELLSLNAAIEASRLKEKGGGFRVISDEIRNLSQKTREFAKNTVEQLQQMVGDIEELSGRTEKTFTVFMEWGNETETLLKTFSEIKQSMEVFSREKMGKMIEEYNAMKERIEEMIKGIKSLARLGDRIATSSQEVSAAMEEESASFQEIAMRSSDISLQMQKLQDEVKKFKVRENTQES